MRYVTVPSAALSADNILDAFGGGSLTPTPVYLGVVELQVPRLPPRILELQFVTALRHVGVDWADKGSALRHLGHDDTDLTVLRLCYSRSSWDEGNPGRHRSAHSCMVDTCTCPMLTELP